MIRAVARGWVAVYEEGRWGWVRSWRTDMLIAPVQEKGADGLVLDRPEHQSGHPYSDG